MYYKHCVHPVSCLFHFFVVGLLCTQCFPHMPRCLLYKHKSNLFHLTPKHKYFLEWWLVALCIVQNHLGCTPLFEHYTVSFPRLCHHSCLPGPPDCNGFLFSIFVPEALDGVSWVNKESYFNEVNSCAKGKTSLAKLTFKRSHHFVFIFRSHGVDLPQELWGLFSTHTSSPRWLSQAVSTRGNQNHTLV